MINDDVIAEGESAVPDVSKFVDLTQHEIQALKTRYNLADAHTHQRQSPRQERIVTDLSDLWHYSEDNLQSHLEQRFLDAFFRLHEQPTAAAMNKTLLSYSASVSTMVAAMYLQQRNMSVSLVTPCFDNLVDLLRHMRVELASFPEEWLHDVARIHERMSQVGTDAIYLVDPNNPTGFTLLKDGRSGFAELLRMCKETSKLLIMDFCFASFVLCSEGIDRVDIYQMLEESGVTYMVIEDTGKTWPVQDAKCAMITASEDIHEDVYNIHTAVLLNVSPFVLSFLTRYVEDSIADGFASVRDVITENRASAREALEGRILEYVPPVVDTSVAWFKIVKPGLTATQLQAKLFENEIYVLPGTYFYWDDKEKGEEYVRIALARRPEEFADAMTAMRKVLLNDAR
ncbi:aspartate/methionine/tyrosine aminotransferase [Kibdelosporangium banguiense]|uniref:Aspartate/methionine/tyrosine aminotransferase n=1 Tax=Kibdelosporangium banguiense TaxID=1365924 RepID=A0ABS4TZ14_9PSEU|nr:aminotransferase class I/II-fold pyridoxal phosphate-dependent enzyme [Kibdelosporangium banguiense]MBP2329643.1 aspartate/methionine/tyrosine aminotransferase [Kibdelosporangium banguiense]